VKDQFARLAAWQPFAKAGNWPDADMLAIGELKPHPGYGEPRSSRLTYDEQKTLLTLWAIAKSPLIVGANLTLLDAKTLTLLTNADVIALDQEGTGEFEAKHEGAMIAWRTSLPKEREALAIFNTGDTPLSVQRDFADFDADLGTRHWKVTDAWAGQELGRQRGVDATLAPHSCLLLVLSPEKLLPEKLLPKLHKEHE